MTSRLPSLCLAAAAFIGALYVNAGGLQAETGVSDPLSAAPPMRFAIVRSADPACEPNCAEWISAEGAFHPETDSEFRKILDVLGKRKLPILIHSLGGNAISAMAIGRLVRARQMDVAVSKTDFKPCTALAKECRAGRPDALLRGAPHSRGAICGSACTLVLAAGAHRFVPPWAGVGVHSGTGYQKLVKRFLIVKVRRFLTSEHEIITEKTVVGRKETSRIVKLDAPPAEQVAKVDAYCKEMGMSDELPKLMAATPPKEVHWLSHAELDATHMATDYYGSEYLIARLSRAETADQTTDASAAAQDEAKTEVASVSYSALKMPGFADHDTVVYFELIHRKDARSVEINALVDDRDGFIPAANVALTVQFGIWTSAPVVVATSELPTSPMVATVPSSAICGAQKIMGISKFTLMQTTSGAKISGPQAVFDIRAMNSMPNLLADICGSDANTAAKKLDRLWH